MQKNGQLLCNSQYALLTVIGGAAQLALDVALRVGILEERTCEKRLFSQLSLVCLSRACLGKMMIFIQKTAQKVRFLTSAT